MKILIMTGALLPNPVNNANLIGKLLPFLTAKHEVHIFATAFCRNDMPETYFGLPVHWVTDSERDFRRNCIYPAVSRIVDPGNSDAVQGLVLLRELKRVKRVFDFDAVISTSEPFISAFAAANVDCREKFVYIMDPPDCMCGNRGSDFRNREIKRILEKHTAILTTPFIRSALNECGYGKYNRNILPVGFPLIEEHCNGKSEIIKKDSGKINLLFCGWMCSEIRSPEYFLRIAAMLDERFCIYFMGRECDKLKERYEFETRAEVMTLPQQPYQTAIDAMYAADILINIGNSIPVHMPSKTLEYINTCKPIVNFYKLDECPTRYYTDRYPLCLNISENNTDIDKAAKMFVDFCIEAKCKTVGRDYIEKEYFDCTPQYIAQQILEKLGDKQ